MKKVVIIGAGGHAKVVCDIIRKNGDTVAGFLDDGKNVGEKFCGANILGKTNDAEKFEDCNFIIAIGSNSIRKNLSKIKLPFYTAIHPSAVIGEDVKIGEGTVIMAGAIINPGTEIGKHCIINSRSVTEHDCKISDYVHISPGAVLCGTVSIAENSWIGAGAVVKNNLSVCENTTVGVGSAVVKNISEAGVYVGVPAVKIR